MNHSPVDCKSYRIYPPECQKRYFITARTTRQVHNWPKLQNIHILFPFAIVDVTSRILRQKRPSRVWRKSKSFSSCSNNWLGQKTRGVAFGSSTSHRLTVPLKVRQDGSSSFRSEIKPGLMNTMRTLLTHKFYDSFPLHSNSLSTSLLSDKFKAVFCPFPSLKDVDDLPQTNWEFNQQEIATEMGDN